MLTCPPLPPCCHASRWFVGECMEALEFVPMKAVHVDRKADGIPIRKRVCSRKCFEEVREGVRGTEKSEKRERES